MPAWAQAITAVTLFTDDLALSTRFYRDVFELPLVFSDDVSAAFRLGNIILNVLQVSAAPELVAPARVAAAEMGVRAQYTVTVPDVDELVDLLSSRGVTFLNGPQDRPWGIRTACFQDPSGHVWELAQDVATSRSE